MHIVDNVQGIYIYICLPLQHVDELAPNIIIVKHIACHRTIFRTYLLLGNFIHTAVQSIQQTFCNICTCAEELHFLADYHGRYTAGDAIVITMCYSHQIIILVLDGRSLDGHLCTVSLPAFRKPGRPQYSQVRFRRRTKVGKCMQITEAHLCYHRSAVYTNTAKGLCNPNGIAGENLVVFRCTCKFDQTQLHDKVVNEFLNLLLGESTVLQISLCIAVKEGRSTSKGHSSTVLLLH